MTRTVSGSTRGGLAVRCEEVVHIYRRGDAEVVALREHALSALGAA